MVDLSAEVSQAEFGRIVGISQQAVSDLARRGILNDHQAIGVWLLAYTSHLREMAAGRATEGGIDLATERARLASEQADKIAMQNAVTRREMAPVYLLEEVLAACGARAAAILDAIPGAIRRRNPALTSADIETIAAEIAKARNIAASITLADMAADVSAAVADAPLEFAAAPTEADA